MLNFDVKDCNGKQFTGSLNIITDINGDIGEGQSISSISDGRREMVNKVHDVEYVDQNGNAIDTTKLLKDMADGKSDVVALNLDIEATHSGKNLNYVIYYEDSMEKDAETFINPFRKPMLKNHNQYSGEPLGRVIQAWHGDSKLTDERSAIHLKVKVTDQETFPKFLDGRYSTVSIGGSMDTVTCNICGKTILKDGKFKFCGHWRGESYKDQVCYWGGRDITYHEVSTVNSPADVYAQIMKVTVITESENGGESDNNNSDSLNNGKENTSMGDENKIQTNDIMDQLNKISSMIDSIKKPSGNDSSGSTATSDSNTQQPQSTANDSLESVKTELEDAKKENEKLKAELENMKKKVEISEATMTAAQDECNNYKDTCLTLAAANKELIADAIIAKEISNGTLEDSAKDSRKKELTGMSMKELMAVKPKEKTEDSQQQRQLANVQNPIKASDGNGDAADTNKSNNNEAKKTVDDFANDIIATVMN